MVTSECVRSIDEDTISFFVFVRRISLGTLHCTMLLGRDMQK